jgi:hypothetical protein
VPPGTIDDRDGSRRDRDGRGALAGVPCRGIAAATS